MASKSILKNLSKKSSSQNISGFKLRYIFVVSLICVPFLLGLLIQMYRWQVLGNEYYTQLAENQLISDGVLYSARGTIYASDGSVLAVDQPVWDVYASLSTDERDRELFDKNREYYITAMDEILGVDPEELDEKLTPDFRYVSIKKEISIDEKKALEEYRYEREWVDEEGDSHKESESLFGLYFEAKEKRVYPDGKLASHLIGFIGKDDEGNDVGRYGLEGYYAGDLLGQEGFQYEEKDPNGNVIMTGEYEPVLPRQGKNIELTIRPAIQAKVEELLKKGVEEKEAKNGTVIVMDPSTGEIIAMATYPDYNPNYYYNESDGEVFRNRAISDVYEYGSVNKPLTVSMALEEEEITPETICHDNTGSIKVLDKTIYTWDKLPDGDITAEGTLINSNNVCTTQFGLKVGKDRMVEYLKDFGIGDFIGVGLEDEATSYLKSVDTWSDIDVAAASFGQMISATPLQITSAISTIANDGVRMRPYVVQRLYDDEESIDIEPEVASRPISKETAQNVQNMMESVVREGEAWGWFKDLEEFGIAGKTGTAQVPLEDSYGYYDDRTNCTFVGFSPVKDAKMIMLVKLSEPEFNQYAASTAVPVWVEIYKSIALDLGIVPTRTVE